MKLRVTVAKHRTRPRVVEEVVLSDGVPRKRLVYARTLDPFASVAPRIPRTHDPLAVRFVVLVLQIVY